MFPKSARRPPIAPERAAGILRDYARGLPVKRIQMRWHISSQSLYNLLRRGHRALRGRGHGLVWKCTAPVTAAAVAPNSSGLAPAVERCPIHGRTMRRVRADVPFRGGRFVHRGGRHHNAKPATRIILRCPVIVSADGRQCPRVAPLPGELEAES